MRARTIVALCLLLPAAMDAQRLPVRGRGPTRPAPLPPQAPTISRDMAYVRLPISFESYAVINHAVAPGYIANGVVSSWTSLGTGTRAEYRLAPLVSATLDITSSLFGGPMMVQTAELGARLGSQRSDQRVYPFADARFGYMYASHTNVGSLDIIGFPTAQQFGANGQYSQGFGGVAGAGMEVAATRTFSVITAASVMQTRMTAHEFRSPAAGDITYSMRTYRYILGLRLNLVRDIQPPGT